MLQLGMLWDGETGCHTSNLAYRKPQSTSLKTPPKNIFTYVLLIGTSLLSYQTRHPYEPGLSFSTRKRDHSLQVNAFGSETPSDKREN